MKTAKHCYLDGGITLLKLCYLFLLNLREISGVFKNALAYQEIICSNAGEKSSYLKGSKSGYTLRCAGSSLRRLL